MVLNGQRAIAGGLGLAAAAAAVLGARLPRQVYPAALAAAAVASAAVIGSEMVRRQGDRTVDMVMAWLEIKERLGQPERAEQLLRVVR